MVANAFILILNKSNNVQDFDSSSIKTAIALLACSCFFDTSSINLPKIFVSYIKVLSSIIDVSGVISVFEKEIDELVQIALRRDRDKNKLTFSYDQNIFALSGGAKGGTKGSKVSKK
jgi:hypothetical protein